MSIAYLDCHAGISEEMLLAALLNAGYSMDAFQQVLYALGIEEKAVHLEPVHQGGLHGYRILLAPEKRSPLSLTEIEALYQSRPAALSEQTYEKALAVLRRMVEAEAQVKEIEQEQIAFTIEKIIVITGCIAGLEALEITGVYASPLPLAGGSIQSSAGFSPIPAPVTLELLRHVKAPWQPRPVAENLVTPLAAALLATLARFDTPTIAIEQIGHGFGTLLLPWPHCLRLCLGHAHGSTDEYKGTMETDWVTVIETNIDNMSGELLGSLMDRLLADGAFDVSYTPMQMKKNRPATLVRVVCAPEDGERLALILLRETSTLGVRMQQVQRRKAQRTLQRIDSSLGPLVVKVKRLGEQIISAAPEYEDCRRLANEHQLPLTEVYEVAQQAIQIAIIAKEGKKK